MVILLTLLLTGYNTNSFYCGSQFKSMKSEVEHNVKVVLDSSRCDLLLLLKLAAVFL